MTTPRLSVAVCLLSTLVPGASARADRLRATLGQPVDEVAHAVDVHVRGGVALLRVRRTFANHGGRHDEASLRINLPYGAAATGLRIRSATGRWFDGELMEAEKAAELYRELTGLGPHAPRDPALLQWIWADEVHLQVFPVVPGSTATVEYTLTVPTHYAGGRYIISYPRHGGDASLSEPVLRVFPQASHARVVVDGRVTAAAQPTVLGRPKVPGWFGADHRPEAGVSYAASALDIPRQARVAGAEVELDIRHTYRGDLRVELIAPSGRWYRLVDQQGSGENDLRGRFKVPFAGRAEQAKGTWRLVVSDRARLDVGRIESWKLHLALQGKQRVTVAATDTPCFVPDAPEEGGEGVARLEVAPSPIRTVAARLGRVVAGPGKQFLRLEVDAAPQLRPLPRRPVVVFVLDASHSAGPDGIRGQLQLVRSFLRHVPDASAEVVLYRRRASRLFGRFAAPAEIDQLVARASKAGRLAPGNGSALGRGVALAAGLLGQHRGGGRRYVVMLGDGLLRSRWRNASAMKWLSRLSDRWVSHVALFRRGDHQQVGDKRDDSHPLSPLATVGGGVLLHVHGLPAGPEQVKELDPVTLGLVRPVRIDGFRVEGPVQLAGIPHQLQEGSGIREMVAAARTPRTLALRGKIWARKFHRQVQVSPAFSRVTAAFVFSHDMHGELSRAEQLGVARMGRAVSPVTSYLAIEPGVRPSTAGIERRGAGMGAGYGRGAGRILSRCARVMPPGLKQLLAAGVRRCVATHRPGAGWSATLAVETTYDEVVDVVLRPPASAVGRCLVQEAWRLRLPAGYHHERESFTLTLP